MMFAQLDKVKTNFLQYTFPYMSNNYENCWLGRLEVWEFFFAGLETNQFGDPTVSRGRFENCIRPFKID